MSFKQRYDRLMARDDSSPDASFDRWMRLAYNWGKRDAEARVCKCGRPADFDADYCCFCGGKIKEAV